MTSRVAVYARSSPDCLASIEDQVAWLRSIASKHGWKVEAVFTDRPLAVRKGLDRRPGETALIEAIRCGMFDKVLIWSIDRIGKSLIELVVFMETCRCAGVSVYLDQQNIDAAGPNRLSMFDMTAMLALHLRQSRRDRILRGQAAARSLSIRFGRPPIPKAKMEKARQELAAGKGVRQVARLAGISPASVSRLKTLVNTR